MMLGKQPLYCGLSLSLLTHSEVGHRQFPISFQDQLEILGIVRIGIVYDTLIVLLGLTVFAGLVELFRFFHIGHNISRAMARYYKNKQRDYWREIGFFGSSV